MQKRSHLLLARALLSQARAFPARRYQWAFLFGSFQPDCNPLSYLKGSLRAKPFGGHTYANARPYIDRHIRRLQARRRRNLWDWYTMGKLTHYVADAFTWPHNPRFPGAGWEHHAYESRLRLALQARLSATPDAFPAPPLPGDSAPSGREPLPDALHALHERYLREARPGLDADISYILRASDWLMRRCCPAAGKLGDFA